MKKKRHKGREKERWKAKDIEEERKKDGKQKT